jgi:hypothetical protein
MTSGPWTLEVLLMQKEIKFLYIFGLAPTARCNSIMFERGEVKEGNIK